MDISSKEELISSLKNVSSSRKKRNNLDNITKKNNDKNDIDKKSENKHTITINGVTTELPDATEVMESLTNSLLNQCNNNNKDDLSWDDLLNDIDSPISDITSSDKYTYKRSSKSNNEYLNMFNKEVSLINAIVSKLEKQDKSIEKALKSIESPSAKATSVRGSYKNGNMYTDLQSKRIDIASAMLSAIKELKDIKKTALDLQLKKEKNSNDSDEDNINVIANSYYNQLMSSSNDKVLPNLISNIVDEDVNEHNNDLDDSDYTYYDRSGFNPSQMDFVNEYDEEEGTSCDPYGYIKNEIRNVEIIVQYDEETGKKMFLALDENGEEVPDYELPSQETLDTIEINPFSNYAFDVYRRRYKVDIIKKDDDLVNVDDL